MWLIRVVRLLRDCRHHQRCGGSLPVLVSPVSVWAAKRSVCCSMPALRAVWFPRGAACVYFDDCVPAEGDHGYLPSGVRDERCGRALFSPVVSTRAGSNSKSSLAFWSTALGATQFCFAHSFCIASTPCPMSSSSGPACAPKSIDSFDIAEGRTQKSTDRRVKNRFAGAVGSNGHARP